ncbi:hypothetical protein [Flammeovirga sp. SubArs3]|uniref:hypothetical protein n=1 Tax=Flammeovirga sp. SubArs3 TaxID=2995316 RepID=UPI00248B4D7E|nr:hypothetical protein [Flammeovirga sp. SubArs3]
MRLLTLFLISFLLFGCGNDEINWSTPTSLDQYFMDEINKHREDQQLQPLTFNVTFFEESKRFAAKLADNPGMREQLSKEEEENGYYKQRIQVITDASDIRGCTGFASFSDLNPTPNVVKIMAQACSNTLDNRNSNTFGGAVFQNSNTGDYFYVTFVGRLDN